MKMMNIFYDPIELAEITSKIVTKGTGRDQYRKYYRFRGGRWYGGIATADCVGCNLRCRFCWSWRVRDNPTNVGEWKTPFEVASILVNIAKKRGYRYVRISGGEPTLSFDHLIYVAKYVQELEPKIRFILETNGILIGHEKDFARRLSDLDNVHVRVSIKGCTSDDFTKLTGAYSWGFELQIKSLENLRDYNVSAHPAVMMSFSEDEDCKRLRDRLGKIKASYFEDFEEEYVFLYPHVKKLMDKYSLEPKIAYLPDDIPSDLI